MLNKLKKVLTLRGEFGTFKTSKGTLDLMKNVFVVIENEHGEIFIKVTSTKELAIKYVKEEATGICTIEKHEIDGNWINTIKTL